MSNNTKYLLAGMFTGAFATTLPFAISTSPKLNLAAARGGRAVGFALKGGGRAIGAGAQAGRVVAFRASHVALKAGIRVAPTGGRFLGRAGSFAFRRVLLPLAIAEGLFKAGRSVTTSVMGGERNLITLQQGSIGGFVSGLTGISESTVNRELFGTTRGQIGQTERQLGPQTFAGQAELTFADFS